MKVKIHDQIHEIKDLGEIKILIEEEKNITDTAARLRKIVREQPSLAYDSTNGDLIYDIVLELAEFIDNYPDEDENGVHLKTRIQQLRLQTLHFGEVLLTEEFADAVDYGFLTKEDGNGDLLDFQGKVWREVVFDPQWLKENLKVFPFVVWYNK